MGGQSGLRAAGIGSQCHPLVACVVVFLLGGGNGFPYVPFLVDLVNNGWLFLVDLVVS